MLFKTISASVYGIDAYPVEVEVDVGTAYMKDFNVVGLPDNAVKESRERIKAALPTVDLSFLMVRASRLILRRQMCERKVRGSICRWHLGWSAARDNSSARFWTK
jgi:hypothetical protein